MTPKRLGAPLFDARRLPGGPWVVAVSGGVDSMTLLWHLRFHLGDPSAGPRRPGPLVVAHLDHGMRRGSSADARWLAGVCRSWRLPFVTDRPAEAPTTEESARAARYDFLDRVRSEWDAGAILTAHHADDQVETVLFRILRGTGVAGLQGIPPRRGAIHRPLLSVSRSQIERYAQSHGVPHRWDPTNGSRRFVRNRLRHDVLPVLAAQGMPDLRRSLLRLAGNAVRAEAEREALEAVAFEGLLSSPHARRREWSVRRVHGWPGALRRRLLRTAAQGLGVSLSAASTGVGVAAMDTLGPGQGVDLSGGLRLWRGRESWILATTEEGIWDEVGIRGREPSVGVFRLGARTFRYEWRAAAEGEGGPTPATLMLPSELSLRLRGWQGGDRIRLPYGSKAVAKLLAERGVPALDRPSTPVVVGPEGSILWIPGTAVADPTPTPAGSNAFVLSCAPESHDWA